MHRRILLVLGPLLVVGSGSGRRRRDGRGISVGFEVLHVLGEGGERVAQLQIARLKLVFDNLNLLTVRAASPSKWVGGCVSERVSE